MRADVAIVIVRNRAYLEPVRRSRRQDSIRYRRPIPFQRPTRSQPLTRAETLMDRYGRIPIHKSRATRPHLFI